MEKIYPAKIKYLFYHATWHSNQLLNVLKYGFSRVINASMSEGFLNLLDMF